MRTGPLATLIGLTALLAGCASAPATEQKIETSRMVQDAPSELVPRITAFLDQQGIEVRRADPDAGLVQGEQRPLERSDWTSCGPVYVRDTDGERRRQAELRGRRLELDVVLDRLSSQTLVTVRPAFIGTFHNSFTNRDFDARCPSSQRLERALLEAL